MKTNEIPSVSVTAESLEILPKNAHRKYLLIQNQDAAAVLAMNVGKRGSGSGAGGLLIQPGQYYEFTQDNGAPEEKIYFSASVATSMIYILEGVQ